MIKYVLAALVLAIAAAAWADPTPIIIDGKPYCVLDNGTIVPGDCTE